MSDWADPTRPASGKAGLEEPGRADATPMHGLGLRYRIWRNRLIGSPGFRRFLSRIPGLRLIAQSKSNSLFKIINGFVFSQILQTCVQLGILDALWNTHLTTEALSQKSGLQTERMRHLLEQAERLRLVKRFDGNSWTLDDAGAVVASDPGLVAMIQHHALFYQDLVDPVALFRGTNSGTKLKKYWAYTHEKEPAAIGKEATQPYSHLMRTSQAMLADCILSAHDFGRYRSLLDVGGGEGAFLAAVGAAHPQIDLNLFDLPSVTDLARTHLTNGGTISRTRFHSGDFAVDPIPDVADCVSLVRILCDHDDDRVLQILSNLHRSLTPGTHVVVAEAMAGESEGAQLAALYFGMYFLAMGSGKCRSVAEIKALLAKSGFRNVRAQPTPNPLLATIVLADC